MDYFRHRSGASQPGEGWQPPQSVYSCTCGHASANSDVTDCSAIAADGRSAPSFRIACAAEKFPRHKGRLTDENWRVAKMVSVTDSELQAHVLFHDWRHDHLLWHPD